jgi:hypothetical protein
MLVLVRTCKKIAPGRRVLVPVLVRTCNKMPPGPESGRMVY